MLNLSPTQAEYRRRAAAATRKARARAAQQKTDGARETAAVIAEATALLPTILATHRDTPAQQAARRRAHRSRHP